MFRRIIWDELLRDAQTVGIVLLGLCIALLVARVLATPTEEVDRLSKLPLSND